MQRAYDQVIHDVCIQNLNVVFCLDRGGLVGADGATHHGVFDIAYFRCLPNMIVASPLNEIELRNMMFTAQSAPRGPFSIRFPRGNGVHPVWQLPFEEVPIGKGQMLRDGQELAILSLGAIGNLAIDACNQLDLEDGLHPAHFDMRYAKPLDQELLHQVFQRFSKIVTLEDGSIQGGFGSAILEFMADNGYSAQVRRLGVPDRFVHHGTQEELYAECGYDTEAIRATVKQMMAPRHARAKAHVGV